MFVFVYLFIGVFFQGQMKHCEGKMYIHNIQLYYQNVNVGKIESELRSNICNCVISKGALLQIQMSATHESVNGTCFPGRAFTGFTRQDLGRTIHGETESCVTGDLSN